MNTAQFLLVVTEKAIDVQLGFPIFSRPSVLSGYLIPPCSPRSAPSGLTFPSPSLPFPLDSAPTSRLHFKTPSPPPNPSTNSRAAVGAAEASGGGSSVDDRISLRENVPGKAFPQGVDAEAQSAILAATSDWLLAGETARAGMIDSIAAENGGGGGGGLSRSGTMLVDDGVFRARLLCPSQVRACFCLRGSALARFFCFVSEIVLARVCPRESLNSGEE